MTILEKQPGGLGVKWSLISQLGRQGIEFSTTIVLTWLLAPSDFGLLGMAMVVVGLMALFRDLGTSAAVIQQNAPSDRLLSSVFWINLAIGAMATGTMCLMAPISDSLFQDARVPSLLLVLSPIFLVSAPGILLQALLERELRFRSLARLEIVASAFGAVVGISSALAGAGVWSLAFQMVAAASVRALLLWRTNRWRPTSGLDWSETWPILAYSLNLTGYNLVNYFSRNADYFLVGRYLGAEALGYYTLAYNMMLYPLRTLSAVFGRAMFPVFARLQEDDSALRGAYLRMNVSIAAVSFPVMLVAVVAAEPLILTVFGGRWKPTAVLLQILGPVGLLQSLGATVGLIYQAKGRTELMLRWGIATGVIVVSAMIIGLRAGTIGVASAYAIAAVALAYPNFLVPFRLIGLRVLDLGRAVWPALANSALAAGAVAASLHALSPVPWPVMRLVVSLCCGATVYFIAIWRSDPERIRAIARVAWGHSE